MHAHLLLKEEDEKQTSNENIQMKKKGSSNKQS
jgi:hypothetical protein